FQRTHTGRGQLVDVAMLDAALAFLPGPVSEYTVAGIPPRQLGNGSVSRKPTASRFRARDGYIVLAVLTAKQFPSLMRARRRARRPAVQGRGGAHRERAGAARDHRGGPGGRHAEELGDAADRRRCAVRLHLAARRDRPPSAARASRRAPDDRLALRADAARRRRVPPGARKSRARPRAADARRAHRRGAARGRLRAGRDRAPASRRSDLRPRAPLFDHPDAFRSTISKAGTGRWNPLSWSGPTSLTFTRSATAAWMRWLMRI